MIEDNYRRFKEDEPKEVAERSYCRSYALCCTLLSVVTVIFSITLLMMSFTHNSIMHHLIDLVPDRKIWKQHHFSPHPYPTQCDSLTCPILSLLHHQSLSSELMMNEGLSKELHNVLNRTIHQSKPRLFDGLYTYEPSEQDLDGYFVSVDRLDSVYNIEDAKNKLISSPLLLTLPRAVNLAKINGTTLEIPVETGRTFHVTSSLKNKGVATYCVVGWDDTYAGGGFIIHGGIHSLGFYTGNVSSEVEAISCPMSRGIVDWVLDSPHKNYVTGEKHDKSMNATELVCKDSQVCNTVGYYTIRIKNRIGWRLYEVQLNHFDDKGSFLEVCQFLQMTQYEMEYVFDLKTPVNRNPYCAYSFLTYEGYHRLRSIFVLKNEMDFKQYSVAFTSYSYTLYHKRGRIDASSQSHSVHDPFGDNVIFPVIM